MKTVRGGIIWGLLTLVCGATAAASGRAESSATPPVTQRPVFTFTLPTLPSISLPSLSFPSLEQFPFLSDLAFPPAALVRATKTEYVEVTRRQTIHPACYTAYKVTAPCLPVRHHGSSGPGKIELNAEHQIHENVDLAKEEFRIEPTRVVRLVDATAQPDDFRDAKYLEFRQREPPKEKTVENIIVETSEGNIQVLQNPFQRQTTEYVTKTVLVTKMERFTDHRVTATLIAKNCLPVDPKIPKCHSHHTHSKSPIVDTPEDTLQGAESEVVPTAVARPNAEASAVVAAVQKVSESLHHLSTPAIEHDESEDVEISGEVDESP